ncbi:hypothetical protein QBC45DRAFT_397997 [Copromyces sp. CBS 386.78]|nr:hypothetical protein QBC45DRAFT_397997 [Copromyces sp. CBS 386.78]
MAGPMFASPGNVSRAADRLQKLCEILLHNEYRFYAIEEANGVLGSWVKAFHREELDPEDDDDDDDDDEGWGVNWADPDQEHDVGTLLALAMGEINAAHRLMAMRKTARALQDCLRKLYRLLYDIIYWDFGRGVGRLASRASKPLRKQPKFEDWILYEPDSSDGQDSTGKPTDECNDKPTKESVDKTVKESTDMPLEESLMSLEELNRHLRPWYNSESTDKPAEECTDKLAEEPTDKAIEELMKPLVSWHQAECTDKPIEESTVKPTDDTTDESTHELSDQSSNGFSSEDSNKTAKVDSKVDDQLKVLHPLVYAAAESLKHLSEQEFQDLSQDYYVHPQVKKVLELRWKAHSRKGKEKARPRYQYAAKHTFMTVDGVVEFVNASQLRQVPLPPRGKTLGQMSKEEYLEVVNARTRKVDPATKPMKRPIGLRTASRLGIPRKTLDESQPATILKRRQVAKLKLAMFQSNIARIIYNRTPLSKPAGVTNLPGLFLPPGSPLPARPPTTAESTTSSAAAITVRDASVEPPEASITVPATSAEPAKSAITAPAASAEPAEAPERGLKSARFQTVSQLFQAHRVLPPPTVSQPTGSLAPPGLPTIVESSKAAGLGKLTEQAKSVQYLIYLGATQKFPKSPTIAESSKVAESKKPAHFTQSPEYLKSLDELWRPPASPRIAESRKPVEFAKLPVSLKSVEGFSRPTGFASYPRTFQSPRVSQPAGASQNTPPADAPKLAGLWGPAEIFPPSEVMQPDESPTPAEAPTSAGLKTFQSARFSQPAVASQNTPPAEAPKLAGLLGPAEIFPPSEVMQPDESPTPVKSSRVAESFTPPGASQNTPAEAPKSAGLLEPAEIFPSPKIMQPAGIPTPAKSPKVAESPKPVGVSRNIGFPKPPEALTLPGILTTPKSPRSADSSGSAGVSEDDAMFPPLDIPPTPSADISPTSRAKRRSPEYTHEPTEVKRRGQVGEPSESPKFKMLDEEEDDVWPSIEGETDNMLSVAPSSPADDALSSATATPSTIIASPPFEDGSATSENASPSSPNARSKAKKRTPPSVENTPEVKRRGEVSGPSESPEFEKMDSEEEDGTTEYEGGDEGDDEGSDSWDDDASTLGKGKEIIFAEEELSSPDSDSSLEMVELKAGPPPELPPDSEEDEE